MKPFLFYKANEKSRKKLIIWRNYFLGFALVILATLLGHFVRGKFDPTNIIMIYLLCVTVSAVIGGFGPSIVVAILSVLVFDFFFVPPHFTFEVADTQYVFTFIALLLVGITISYLTSQIRRETENARQRERETAALYRLGRDLAVAGDLDSYIKIILERIEETLGHRVVIYLPENEHKGKFKIYTPSKDIAITEKEISVARYAFENKKSIGRGTDNFSNAEARYFPLVTARNAIGLMALQINNHEDELTLMQERLLEAYADLAAVAIESIMLADELHKTKVLQETEKLQTALLNAISHDLRTPLVSVIGVLSSLEEENIGLDDNARKNLVVVAREEAERLNRLITNLLDESRIEAGAIKLSKQITEVQDLIGAALEQLGSRVRTHHIAINIPLDMPFISIDCGLIIQALVNILENALKFSPSDQPIEIQGHYDDNRIYIKIADRGIGIPSQNLSHIFEKFYSVKRAESKAGTGLGLYISKAIIEAHGGDITAENRAGGGTVIKITLAAYQPPPSGEEKVNG